MKTKAWFISERVVASASGRNVFDLPLPGPFKPG